MPLISVVLPTYNASVSFLKEAVDSILNQSLRDLELIVVDDGSADETPAYLGSLTDPRVRVIRNGENLGTTRSLNIGFRSARGKYIARMDSDDVSMPDRFEKQFAFMEEHPDVIACGCEVLGEKGRPSPGGGKMEDMESYRIRMLFANPGPYHPTAFFRRDALIRHAVEYDENLRFAQDYGMWMTLSQYGRICILPDHLLYHRVHPGQVSMTHREEQIRCDKRTQRALLSRLLDHVTEEELDLHYRYSTGYYPDVQMTAAVKKWYGKLILANDRKAVYDRRLFREAVYRILFRTLRQTWPAGTGTLRKGLMFLRYMPFRAVGWKLRSVAVRRLHPDSVAV